MKTLTNVILKGEEILPPGIKDSFDQKKVGICILHSYFRLGKMEGIINGSILPNGRRVEGRKSKFKYGWAYHSVKPASFNFTGNWRHKIYQPFIVRFEWEQAGIYWRNWQSVDSQAKGTKVV